MSNINQLRIGVERSIQRALSKKSLPVVTFESKISYKNKTYSLETIITSCPENLYTLDDKSIFRADPSYKLTIRAVFLINEINKSVRDFASNSFIGSKSVFNVFCNVEPSLKQEMLNEITFLSEVDL